MQISKALLEQVSDLGALLVSQTSLRETFAEVDHNVMMIAFGVDATIAANADQLISGSQIQWTGAQNYASYLCISNL